MSWSPAGASGVTCKPYSGIRKRDGSRPRATLAGRAASCSSGCGARKSMRSRRQFLKASAGGLLLAGANQWMSSADAAREIDTGSLPAGTLDSAQLGTLTGKLPLIKKSFRPPNFETPVKYFSDVFTPNNAFFVRYHLAGI